MTREERRYWRRECIKAAIAFFVLIPAVWCIVAVVTR